MVNRGTHILVTGATGFIGRHLVFRLLAESDLRLTLIVRARSSSEAEERVAACLAEVADELGTPLVGRLREAIRVLSGDVRKPLCGLTPGAVRELCIDEIWHLAASLSFDERSAAETHEHNVDGTRHALELAAFARAKRFVYVSTAYVCGSATGAITEALQPLSGPFNNAYEQSKCAAEHLVSSFGREHGFDHRIVRPSIVVGLSNNHAPAGSETGLYGFVRELVRMRRVLESKAGPVRLVADRDATLNFIAVDEFVRELMALARRDFVGGPVYHLTGDGSPTVGQTLDVICDAVGVPRFELVSKLSGDVSPLERLLARRVAFYASYLCGTKTFVRAAQRPAARLGASEIQRYVSGFLAWRRRGKSELVERRWNARDGFPLTVASAQRALADVVVLVNALGMPHAALEKLSAALRPHYTVLTWESRGAPSLDGELDEHNVHPDRHVDDLEDLLDEHGVARAHLVGWCTGADVALSFARRAPARVQSLSCLNGAFMGLVDARLPYQVELEALVRRCARSEAHARLYHSLIGELLGVRAEPVVCGVEQRESLRSTLSVLEPDLMHITGVPLRSPESFFRYCRLLQAYFDQAPRALPEAGFPALVVSSEDDAIAHVDASRSVAKRLGAKLHVSPRGGHFAPCRDDALLALVLEFIASQATEPVSLRRCA